MCTSKVQKVMMPVLLAWSPVLEGHSVRDERRTSSGADNSLGGSCGLVPSLNTRETRTPTPSNTLSRMPHATAELSAERGPPMRNDQSISNVAARHYGCMPPLRRS